MQAKWLFKLNFLGSQESVALTNSVTQSNQAQISTLELPPSYISVSRSQSFTGIKYINKNKLIQVKNKNCFLGSHQSIRLENVQSHSEPVNLSADSFTPYNSKNSSCTTSGIIKKISR